MGFNRQQVPKYQNAAAKSKGVATPQKQAPQQAQMANMLRSFAGGQATQPQVRNQAGTGQMGNIMGMGQAQQQPSPTQMPQRPQRPQGMGGKGGRSPRPPQPQIGMQQGLGQQQNKWNAMPAQEQAKYDQSTQQQMDGRMTDMMYRGGQQQGQGNWQQRMGQSPLGRAQQPQMGGKGGRSPTPPQFGNVMGAMGGGSQTPQPMQQASQAPQRRMGGKGGRSQMPSQYRR